MNKETFTKAVIDLLPSCEREAIPIWFSFAAECVDNEQFVDFVPETNKAAAIEKWLDSIYTGIYFVKKDFGEDTASKICNLSLLKSCIYPYEMKLAAEHIQNGGDISKISKLSVYGMLDGPPPFFPRIEDVVDDMRNSSGTIRIYKLNPYRKDYQESKNM